MLPILAPILATLAANGLSLLSSAIMAKGTDAVEKVLGIKIPSDASKLTPEVILGLKQAELNHEATLQGYLLEYARLEQAGETRAADAVDARWQADMASDSRLARNIRPMVLLYLLGLVLVFGAGSAFGHPVNESYVKLVELWGGIALSAYFIGRTHEKATEIKANKSV
jgi:hypothetical protein